MNPLEIGCERAERSFSTSRRGATGHRLPPGAAEPGPLFPLSQRPAAVPTGATGKGPRSGRIFPAVNPFLNKSPMVPARAARPARFSRRHQVSSLPPRRGGAFCCCCSPRLERDRLTQDSHLPPGQTGSCLLEGLFRSFSWGGRPFAAEMRKISTPGCVKLRHFKAMSLVISQILDFLSSPPTRPGSCILSLFQSRPWPAAWRRS